MIVQVRQTEGYRQAPTRTGREPTDSGGGGDSKAAAANVRTRTDLSADPSSLHVRRGSLDGPS